jgi:putative ABC transport system permease protein
MLLVLAEALISALIGGLLGLFMAQFFIAGFAEKFATTLPGLAMTNDILFMGFALSLLLGLVTGAVPSIQGLRLNIVTALRRR